MEDTLKAGDTGLSFLARHLGLENRIVDEIRQTNESVSTVEVACTVKKESRYLLDNDEVPDISYWNAIQDFHDFDVKELDSQIMKIQNGEPVEERQPEFHLFTRQETEEKQRRMVSLAPRDRILTTHLALLLYKHLRGKAWPSYSYHVSLLSEQDIFYPWFSSWGRYVSRIRTFLDISFLGSYNVLYIDLKKFYNHVDFLTVFNLFQKEMSEEPRNIFNFLLRYNDTLMAGIQNGSRIGVPQGPAYARIIAEFFLSKVLEISLHDYEREAYYLYRYVDDIVIFCKSGVDYRKLYSDVTNVLMTYGLPYNSDKSQCFGKVADLSVEQRSILLHADKMNYDLTERNTESVLFPSERQDMLLHFLDSHAFDINMIGYMFSDQTIAEAQQWCLNKHAADVYSSRIGRGNYFRKFYHYLWKNDETCIDCLGKAYFSLIPLDTINFDNCLATLYLDVQAGVVSKNLFSILKTDFLAGLDEADLTDENRAIRKALLLT